MNYGEFLSIVIEDGLMAAKDDYSEPKDKMRLDGAVVGFEACRGKSPDELEKVLSDARTEVANAFTEDSPAYWFWRSKEGEIEWVCNVVGAALRMQIGGAFVTSRGVMKAAEVLAKGDGCLVVERGG